MGGRKKLVTDHRMNAATNRVKAFALTLERKGGVPKAEGPILLVGKN